MIIVVLKFTALVLFSLAAVFSIRNYMITRFASGVWGLMSMGLLTGAVLIAVRFIKEFFWADQLEVVKICLLPVMMTFILAASFELRRDILKPV